MHHLRLVDFFPFLSWIKGYGRRHVKADIVAGLTVAVVVMGASLRHDVHHRVRGSLPLQVLSKTESSLLLAKLPPELDIDFFEDLESSQKSAGIGLRLIGQ